MAYKYLQSFLDSRLFTIAEENSNYQFLTATIPLFEKGIAKNKHKIIHATLVALDQNVPQDDSILDEAEELLKKKWPLVRNKYTDRPTTLLRAIILESLFNLMQENKVIANIIWLTGSNLFPFLTISNETTILKEWLREAGTLAENNAAIDWEMVTSVKAINIPSFTLGKIKLPTVLVDKASFAAGLNAAAMNGAPLTQNSNTYGNNYGVLKQEWSTAFSNAAAETFFNVFSNAFTSVTDALNGINIDKPINDFFTTFKDDFGKTLSESLKSGEKLRLRSQILWWKEALYSASTGMSYREMTPSESAMNMAIDLAAGTPPIYPLSIDYILKETLLSCLGTDEADKPIGELVKSIKMPETQMKTFGTTENGRITFGAFVASQAAGSTVSSDLFTRTGIPPETKVSYRQVATLLFHDIQALQIAIK